MMLLIRSDEKEKTPPAGEPWEKIFFTDSRRPCWTSSSDEADVEHFYRGKTNTRPDTDRHLF